MMTPTCDCARGWMCAAHANQPFGHNHCAACGRRCPSPVCPYWQHIAGAARPLALEVSVQLESLAGWTDDGRWH
jgi:hypothetical protein